MLRWRNIGRSFLSDVVPLVMLLAGPSGSAATEGEVSPRDLFPLADGNQWTYQKDGRYAVEMRVVGHEKVADADTYVLRTGWSNHGFGGESLLTTSDGALRLYGRRYDDFLMTDEPPWLLIDRPVEAGAAWRSQGWHRTGRGDMEYSGEFEATVIGLEQVTVPAGVFRAWKLQYVQTAHLGSAFDTNAWFAPGVGLVKLEYWRESRFRFDDPEQRPAKEPMRESQVYELAKFELNSDRAKSEMQQAVDACQVRELVPRLGEPDEIMAQSAADEIRSLGPYVIPELFESRSDSKDDLVRARIGELLGSFGKLVLVGRATSPTSRIGERLPVEFRLRNEFPVPVNVLPMLDGSADGRCPRYTIEIRRQDGALVEVPPAGRGCLYTNPLRRENFVELRPGFELDPLGPAVPYRAGSDPPESLEPPGHRPRHYVLHWTPSDPGQYSVRCIYDATADPDDRCWLGDPGANTVDGPGLLRRMPRGRFESNVVTVTVEP